MKFCPGNEVTDEHNEEMDIESDEAESTDGRSGAMKAVAVF